MENEMMIKPADTPAETTDGMLTRLASEINAIKEQTRKTVYLAMMDIGQRLLQAKGAVGHGNWEKWLKDNVDYSPRTAQRLIASYERFGDGQQKLFGRSADPEQLAELNKTQIMTLMSIKDEEKCFEFMEEHKGEIKDMSKTELEAIAKELNDTVAELNRAKRKLDASRSTADSYRKRLEDREGVIEAYQKQVSDLQSQLEEAGESRELEAVSKDIKTPEEKAFGHHLMNVKSEMEAAITQLMAISDGEKRTRYAMLLRKLLKGTLSMTSWAEG